MSDQSKFDLELVGEKTIKARQGQSILEASLQAGVPHFHACGGNAECSTCRVLVVEGMDKLSPVNRYEQELRETINLPRNIRLACQTQVEGGPVRVRRIILDEADISVYIKNEMNSAVTQSLGEKKELVLFFLDIRNFTPFVEEYLPFDVIHVVRAVHTIFNTVITAFEGVIVDTAGDGFYAVFGLSTSIDEAADKAIRGGFAIQKELKRFNETYLEPYFGAHLEIGIGLHSGEVIVGEVMVGQKSHLSVMGLAVNIASRIQASTRKLDNSFIASKEVMDKAKHHTRGKGRIIRLRGVSGVFKVYLIGEPYKVTAAVQ
jgi:adenylate cyclase